MAGIGDISVLRMLITEVFSLRSPSRSWALVPPQSNLDVSLAILGMEKPSDRLILEFEEAGEGIISEVLNLALPQIGIVGGCNRNCKGILTQAENCLLQNLPAGALAVIDMDCLAEVEAAGHIVARPVYYGLNPAADFWADNVESLGAEGIRFWMHYRTDEFSLRVPLLGHRSVHNAIQAAAAGLCDGLTWQEVAAALRRSSPELRLVTLPTEGGAYILDDTYSISSESALAVLNLLERMEGRKVAVLGEISEEDVILDGNELIGNRAAEVVQELIAVGERAYPIAEAARKAGLANHAIIWVKTAQEAVDHLRQRLQVNDVVLVKGSERQSMISVVTSLEAAA
jgi:UDP-N-acetylmuramoyl-tripeptide--D-alanyl-D-alanine ligase